MRNQEAKLLAQELKTQAYILGGFVAIFWIVEIVDLLFFGGALARLGIKPHSLTGLRGILFAPFLHGGLAHLIANTIPFITLGWFVMLQRTSDFFIVTAITMLVSGLGIWLFGTPGFHIGASSLIFGYLGFLLLRGYFQRNFASILLSVIVGLFYGGLLLGVLPSQPGISWEGHLFGFIGGVLAARLIAKQKRSVR
ncbi:MAG: rhomboid family intramembrane serine protease [Cyanobacteria bacterium QS_7_48_42]|jgi:membrane associated rhomboid family serine protease|nr:MAG: rhomboid family intramembrane serine protease [Cyanobacteria bacterium QS_5_48_63]PSO81478.1 MAG: rhomboid family intramembrane serine protease [Cyanobacteria bacterium QS_4_48_99]PSO85354.1 MAG: rhomboid family intramembrane serine protease [Cyanobacteria bacterium QH_9_48_43]PSO87109.1 MAG: rhomboid family intramembrane serine protease [Cyanobacteria bacterium QS_3_48_167]PSO99871.1 MAG: rhomboid family intramembrane serine protease [Cyanobacteria bacterium QS_7_48_42]PSP05809.1 MAG: